MNDRAHLFRAYLDQYDQHAWSAALAVLRSSMHDVDRTATEIWFHFYPLVIARALAPPADRDTVMRKLWLQGQPDLRTRIDSSHTFLYGHRYWPLVVSTIDTFVASGAAPASLELAELVRELAVRVAEEASRAGGGRATVGSTRVGRAGIGRVGKGERVDPSLTIGITAVGLMTLQQVGPDSFSSAGRLCVGAEALAKTPEQVLAARARNRGQGLLGFLKGGRHDHRVTFDEHDADAWFRIIETQHITTAAAYDTRDYRAKDARCSEGPIPVQCRSASCGTCWVGVLGGRDQLSPVEPRERQRLREFGYLDTDDPQPIIRLTCMAQANGPVSIVIPPYNGIFGKYRRQEEQPATAPGAAPTIDREES
jgi:ferredoxin